MEKFSPLGAQENKLYLERKAMANASESSLTA